MSISPNDSYMPNHPHFLWADLFRREKTSQKNIIQFLKNNSLFCTLSPKELQYLAGFVYERVYQADEPIFHQNDRGIGMYLITKGHVAIKTQTPNGEHLVTTLTVGSFFGEVALVDPDNVRTASAISTDRSILIGFFKPDLMEILERKPAMGVKILLQLSKVLGRRLLETTDKITQLVRELEREQKNGETPR